MKLFLAIVMISGDRVFSAENPLSGIHAVVSPAPECKQASAQSKAAPIVSLFPAMISA